MAATTEDPVLDTYLGSDSDGTPVYVNDRVMVVGSERYGDGEGTLLGLTDDRFRIRLDAAPDESYTSSRRRVTFRARAATMEFAPESIAIAMKPGFDSILVPLSFPTPKKAQIDAVTHGAPTFLRKAAREIRSDNDLNEGMAAMMERAAEFKSPLAAMLAGIAMVPAARRHLDVAMDTAWAKDAANDYGIGPNSNVSEVVIGGGLHAAIYCAVRVALGFPPPLVVEGCGRVGGSMAYSAGPSFYLNSRNRPGSLSIPGERDGSLNVLPGAVVQPSDLSGGEYQSNDDLAFAIRTTLALNARVIPGRAVTAMTAVSSMRPYRVTLSDASEIFAHRVVVAAGLGGPVRMAPWSDRVLSFADLMARMDQPFPLRGLGRVAVIGAGDSGKTAIEALHGQGPRPHMSVAGLDWIDRTDWYGCGPLTCESWESQNRSRYKPIGRLLPRENGQEARVQPMGKAKNVSEGYDSVYVNEKPYDHVVQCLGFVSLGVPYPPDWKPEVVDVGARQVARRIAGQNVYVVGPAAALDRQSIEANAGVTAQIKENTTSLFRYASRTAALASRLPAALA